MGKTSLQPPCRFAGLSILSILTSFLGLPAGVTLGEGFRVENRIYSEDDTEPSIVSTTIFYDDVVYDYLENPKEITVFDRQAGRIILLDPVQKIRTQLTTQDLEALSEQLRDWASGQPDAFLRFAAEPKFAEEYDASTGQLRLSSEWLSYRVETTEAARSEIVQLYRGFCDWYCLLNTRLNPGSRPPFARMMLNGALERLGRMPSEVHLVLRPEGERLFGGEMTARSEHHVVPHLLESDRSRVVQTDQFTAMFRPLAFREYQMRISDGSRGTD